MKAKLFWCSVFIALWSCTKPPPEMKGIDWAIWKADSDGCLNKRAQFLGPLTQQKDQLKALSEMEIIDLLGKPDQNELYERNQKFYTYFFQPGPGCDHADSLSQRLIIRFNAVGLAKEISIE